MRKLTGYLPGTAVEIYDSKVRGRSQRCTVLRSNSVFLAIAEADNYAPNNGTSISDPILVDAILDRLVHTAYKIDLKG